MVFNPAWIPKAVKYAPAVIKGIDSMFQNKDPDKDLWGEQVRRITGHDPDGWGSGGDWSEWLMQKYGLDKGTADHYGGQIRQKQMSPDQAISEITGGESSSAPESRSGGVSDSGRFGYDVPELPDVPEFQRPKKFDTIQDQLSKIGTDILGGDAGDYFGEIGEVGGKLFDNMMAGITADIAKRSAEAQVASGRGRGGTLAQVTAENVGKISSQLRWEDMTRAITGRQFLLGAGTNMLSGVRDAEAGMSNVENQYGLSKAQLERAGILDIEGLKQQAQSINDRYELGMISAEQKDRELALLEDRLAWNKETGQRDFDWKVDTYEDKMVGGIGTDISDIFTTGIDIYKGLTGQSSSSDSSSDSFLGKPSGSDEVLQGELVNSGSASQSILPITAEQSTYSGGDMFNSNQSILPPKRGKARLRIPTYA